jgi:hypothetical protein
MPYDKFTMKPHRKPRSVYHTRFYLVNNISEASAFRGATVNTRGKSAAPPNPPTQNMTTEKPACVEAPPNLVAHG